MPEARAVSSRGGADEQCFELGDVGQRCLGDETAGMREVDARGVGEAGEVDAGVVAVALETVAGAAAIGADDGNDFFFETTAADEAIETERRFVGQRIGAWEEKDLCGLAGEIEGPDFGVLLEKGEAGAERRDIGDEVRADEAHHFPKWLAGLVARGERELFEERGSDGRVEAGEDVGRGAEPFGGIDRTASVEPLGGFEPIAELAGVVVESEVLQHERERTSGRMILGKLVMIEVVEVRLVTVTNVDNADGSVGEFGRGRFAAHDGHRMAREQNAAGEKLVGVRTTGMREKGMEGSHEAVTLRSADEKGRATSERERRDRCCAW